MRIIKKKRLEKRGLSSINAIKIYFTTDMHMRESTDRKPDDPNAKAGDRYYYASMTKFKQMIENANNNPLDAFFICGDIFEDSKDFEWFNAEYDKIDNSMIKALTIGNHDSAGGVSAYNSLVTGFGYQGNEEIAGSKFNYVVSLSNDYASVKCIFVDTNFDNNGVHNGVLSGVFTNSEMQWVESEIANSTEDVILLVSHSIPHLYSITESGIPYFNVENANAIQNMVESYPRKKIYAVGGHHHVDNVVEYNNLGNMFKGYVIPSLSRYESSNYVVMNILPNKTITFDTYNVVYN